MDDIQRAESARQILDNPLFAEALAALDADLARQRQSASITDSALHARLIIAEQVRGKFEAYLRRVLQDGEIAQRRIDLEEKQRGLTRIFRR